MAYTREIKTSLKRGKVSLKEARSAARKVSQKADAPRKSKASPKSPRSKR